MTAVIFGFFASVWFGWAQEAPPARWRPWLTTASIVSLVTAAGGGLLSWRHWNDGTAYDRDTSITFGIILAIEFGIAGLGAAMLAIAKRRQLTSAWIALVVGVHFFPLAWLISYPLLYLVASLVTVAALAAVPVARRTSAPVSLVTGVATGAILLVSALVSAFFAL